MAFTSPEELMKNLPKAMGDISKMISEVLVVAGSLIHQLLK